MSFSRVQSLRLATVMEDCSNHLDILELTLTLRLGKEQQRAAAQEEKRLTKLRGDCQDISKQISKLHLELEEKQSFSSLQQVLMEEGQKGVSEKMRSEVMEQRKQEIQKKQEELEEKKQDLKARDEHIAVLKAQLLKVSLNNDKMKKFHEATTNQWLMDAQSKQSQAKQQLAEEYQLMGQQLEEEARHHEFSVKYLQKRHEDLQQLQQQWQQSTGQMLQEQEQKHNSVSCKRTMNADRLAEARRKLREMEKVLIEDKEEQEKLQQQEARARDATKIQAWWRGCMVRRGLGRFKKAEETNQDEKKEGKKKKKKKK